MLRKIFATTFVLALAWLAQVSLPRPAAALTPAGPAAAACTKHVCDICVASGLACTPIPYCHCF